MVGHGFDHGVCLVLARAMLWRIFDSSGDGLVPDCICSHVVGAYSDLGQWNALENGTNLVEKVPLAVDGHDLEVINALSLFIMALFAVLPLHILGATMSKLFLCDCVVQYPSSKSHLPSQATVQPIFASL